MEHSNGYTVPVKPLHTGRQPTVVRYVKLTCCKCNGDYLLPARKMLKGYSRSNWTCPSCRSSEKH